MLAADQINQFVGDGYLIVPDFLSAPECEKLYGIALSDDVMLNHSFNANDSSGKKSKLSLWYIPGDDALLTRQTISLSQGTGFPEKEKDEALK